MSIDKESSGLPEVNVHRPTTRVNLWMIAGIVMFLVVGAAAAYVIAQQAASPTGASPSATGNN
jgi:hypothetical protein